MPEAPTTTTATTATTARDLVLRYGWNSTAYQILNRGIAHWQPRDDRPGVVGYVTRGRHVIAAGAPVCAENDLPAVAAAFESWARAGGRHVCYFGAEARLTGLLARSPRHATFALGAQPVWDPAAWADEVVARRPSLRSQLRRASRKGVGVIRRPARDAAGDAGVRACLGAWLASKPLPPMRFLVEPELLPEAGDAPGTLGDDAGADDRLVLVATQSDGATGAAGARPVGFLVASPVPCRNGYLIEQVVRRPDAPNGTAEMLIDAAMRHLAARGSGYATLGLVALADHAAAELARNPAWLRWLLGWARAHGRRFYNFAGLEQFRAKMGPGRWDPVYAIVNEPAVRPPVVRAIASAFAAGSPEVAVARAIGRAARREVQRAVGAARRWGRARVAAARSRP